jgi:hypothetical protein
MSETVNGKTDIWVTKRQHWSTEFEYVLETVNGKMDISAEGDQEATLVYFGLG